MCVKKLIVFLAASYGHLDLLQWLIKNTCPWSHSECKKWGRKEVIDK